MVVEQMSGLCFILQWFRPPLNSALEGCRRFWNCENILTILKYPADFPEHKGLAEIVE